jgi:sialate O-acetylesterase
MNSSLFKLAPAITAFVLIFNLQTARAADEITVTNSSALQLAAIFGDNMVLQQQQTVPVWGWAAPDANVTVKFAGQTKSAHSGADGKWLVKFGKLKASAEPQSLLVTWSWRSQLPNSSGWLDSRVFSETFTNILVGEVWLASGQSNMEKPVGLQRGQKPVFNSEQEIAAANYPGIRLFKVEKGTTAGKPLTEFKVYRSWQPCTPTNLDGSSFSAAAYFFGREIHTNLNVPVGLIESTWGGTKIEPWTPPAGFESVPGLAPFAHPPAGMNFIASTRPSTIYNAMIAPLAGFAMRGALWYQGESNLMGTNSDNDYLTYVDKMKALVGGWRQVWGEGDFPFYFVQIAPCKYAGAKVPRDLSPEMMPEFWTLQSRAAREIKNTGMVVTTDLVDDLNDIHPRDKQDVGHRLALLARNKTYGEKNVVCEGPVFKKVKIEGDKVVLTFDRADGGLMSKDGQPLTWFTIAGADGKYVPADAKVVGDTVEVSAAGIEKPVAVRFAWDETAQPNLCNKAGLPAEPFRTDEPAGE